MRDRVNDGANIRTSCPDNAKQQGTETIAKQNSHSQFTYELISSFHHCPALVVVTIRLFHLNGSVFRPTSRDLFQRSAFGLGNQLANKNDRQQCAGAQKPKSTIRSQMFLEDRKHLVSQETDQPERCRCNGHAASENLCRINLRDDDSARHAIAKRMTGDEGHHTNQHCHAAAVDVIEPTDQRERNELHGGTSQDQGLASGAVHQPDVEESKHKIDQTNQHELGKCVAGRSSGGSENIRKKENNGVIRLICCSPVSMIPRSSGRRKVVNSSEMWPSSIASESSI